MTLVTFPVTMVQCCCRCLVSSGQSAAGLQMHFNCHTMDYSIYCLLLATMAASMDQGHRRAPGSMSAGEQEPKTAHLQSYLYVSFLACYQPCPHQLPDLSCFNKLQILPELHVLWYLRPTRVSFSLHYTVRTSLLEVQKSPGL